mgnify:CR=1 FL=1
MRQLRDDTHLILDGEVRVYRRERSQRTLPPLPSTQQRNHPPEYIDACARAWHKRVLPKSVAPARLDIRRAAPSGPLDTRTRTKLLATPYR